MGVWELMLLAVGVSMDAFAVSICKGLSTKKTSPLHMAKCLYRMATCSCLKPVYVGGTIYGIFCLLNRLLPKRLVNAIVGKLYC